MGEFNSDDHNIYYCGQESLRSKGVALIVNKRVGNALLLLLSHFSCVWLFATPWTVAHQAPASMGFSRQEYWSGLPFPLHWNALLGHSPQNCRMILVHFQGKSFYSKVMQVYVPTTNSEEVEVEWFYEGLWDLLKLTPECCPFPHRDWNAKVGSQEISGITGKFGRGVQNEAGQRLTEFCQENSLAIANTLCQQHKRDL